MNQSMSFNGAIGSLGDKPSSSIHTVVIENRGNPNDFKARCQARYAGKEIIEESCEKNKDGVLVWTARIRSQNGI